jgi:hypothetical protein
VAAAAHDFGFVADAFTVGAAVLFFSVRDAIAGRVCTFLGGVSHVISSVRQTRVSEAFRA